ncbi:MAG TPA: hypothetical protein VHA56_10870 [Mucilaginibacter sp.]|nr:hypothetical protein [Mucilaginibacter sp.]
MDEDLQQKWVYALITGKQSDRNDFALVYAKSQWSDPVVVFTSLLAFTHASIGLIEMNTPQFGKTPNQTSHAVRHLKNAGVTDIEAVKRAIVKDLGPSANYKIGVRIKKTITVNGVLIEYSGTKLPSGKINIGSIRTSNIR